MDKEKLITLVTLAQSGDSDAMETCLRLAYPSVSYQCKKILQTADYEDMVQETLLAIYQKLDTLENPAAFVSWANRIAATRCINYVNRHPKEFQFIEFEDGTSSEEFIEELDKQKIPDEKVDSAETSRMVQKLIDGLPDAQRISVYLFYYDGFSVKQIAKLMQTTENTVKSRLNYARKAIKEGVLDYERKDGVKLYSLSPLPFLLYFMRRMAASSADPAAAEAAAQAVVSSGTVTYAAGSSATGSTRSGERSAKPPRRASKPAPSAPAAAKASGVFAGTAAKVTAGVVALTITVGGIGYALGANHQDAAEPAVTQSYVEAENTSPVLETESLPEATMPEETTEPVAAEPCTILRTTIDTTGYDCEMYLETPEFAETSDGYRKINKFFEDMRSDYLSGKDEKVAFMFQRLETQEYPGYAYTQACTLRCQTELFVSVSINSWWYAGGSSASNFSNYTFDAQTGELLELTDLINGTKEEVADYIVTYYKSESGENCPELSTDYDKILFYIEDNQIWVSPAWKEPLANAFLPYIALPGELE